MRGLQPWKLWRSKWDTGSQCHPGGAISRDAPASAPQMQLPSGQNPGNAWGALGAWKPSADARGRGHDRCLGLDAYWADPLYLKIYFILFLSRTVTFFMLQI